MLEAALMQDPRKFINSTRLNDDPRLPTALSSVTTEVTLQLQECLNGPFRYAALAESVLAELGFRRAPVGGQRDRGTLDFLS